jgi:uncharacterized protein YbcI
MVCLALTFIALPAGFFASPPPFEHAFYEGDERGRLAVADLQPADAPGMPAQISSSLAAVWSSYAGERPTDVSTVIRGTKIACVLKDAVSGFDEGMIASAAAEPPPERKLTASTYRNDAIKAVERVTRRRVMAFMTDHDEKTNVATERFILDSAPRGQSSMFVERRED